MRKLLLYALPLGLIISVITVFNSNSYSQQTSSVKTTINSKQASKPSSTQKSARFTDDDDDDKDADGDDMNFTSSNSQVSNNSNYQTNSLSISAANLKKPHILKINSPNAKLQGEIRINGKVVRRLKNNQLQINLSPYLSRGQQKIKISGRYTPATASVTLEMNSADNNITQQTSGNGILNYILDINVQ